MNMATDFPTLSTGFETTTRYMIWTGVALLASGGLGGYLNRRPTAYLVVMIWYCAVYDALASYRLGVSILPPLFAVALSLLLGRSAKRANQESLRNGKLPETMFRFSGAQSLSFAFSTITVVVMLLALGGADFANVIPGFQGYPVTRKLVLGIMLFTGLPVMMWTDTIAHAGLHVLRTVPTMAVIFPRSKRGQQLLATLVLCLVVFHWPSAREMTPLRWEMTITLTATIALLWLQPPFLLLLGASDPATGEVLTRLSSVAFPFRVVALLDRNRTPLGTATFSWRTDDLRTADEDDWRAVVDRLIDIMPLIVLDARTDRAVVVEEARRLLTAPNSLARTIFVVSENDGAPALSLNGADARSDRIRRLRSSHIQRDLDFAALTAERNS